MKQSHLLILLLLALPLVAMTCYETYEERGDITITIAADSACSTLLRGDILIYTTDEVIDADDNATFPYSFRVDALRKSLDVGYRTSKGEQPRYQKFEFTSGRDTTFVVSCP